MFEDLTERHPMSQFLKLDCGPMSHIPLEGSDTLYLGNIPNALTLTDTLNKRAWAVLNCTDDPALDYMRTERGYDMLRLNHWDGEPYPGMLIKVGIEFIRDNIAAGSAVLVCCHAGMSRSPGMVVSYLMYRWLQANGDSTEHISSLELRKEAYDLAIAKTRKSRPIIHIHPKIDLSVRQYFGLAPKTAEDLVS